MDKKKRQNKVLTEANGEPVNFSLGSVFKGIIIDNKPTELPKIQVPGLHQRLQSASRTSSTPNHGSTVPNQPTTATRTNRQ